LKTLAGILKGLKLSKEVEYKYIKDQQNLIKDNNLLKKCMHFYKKTENCFKDLQKTHHLFTALYTS